jgi:hypothetical protein
MTTIAKESLWIYRGGGTWETEFEFGPTDPEVRKVLPKVESAEEAAAASKMRTGPEEMKMLTPDAVGEVRKGRKLRKVSDPKLESPENPESED